MRIALVVLGLAGVVLAATAATNGASVAAARATVTIRDRSCKVYPAAVRARVVRFTIVNRTRRTRGFSIAYGRSDWIRPRRTGALSITFRAAGNYTFSCFARTKPFRVTHGVFRVLSSALPPPPPPPVAK